MKKRIKWRTLASLTFSATSALRAQTTVTGNSLALRSSGAATGGTSWLLSSNGYVGTYITLPSAGTVTLAISASGTSDAGVAPKMDIVVDDSDASFSVAAGTTNYSTTLSLPAGTHFVRTQFTNADASRNLTIANLQVTGATVSNSSTDGNATNAANTYIQNFRKGNATISLTGPGNIPLLAGTSVPVDMARNAFNFGGTVSGSTINDSKDMLVPNPAVGTEANQFQQFINQYFNTIVPSNGGKWANNEPTQNNLTMQLVDRQLAYAQAHNMRARMHNLIWGSSSFSGMQQPSFVNTLIASAAGGNTAAATTLRNDIASRINYYVGTNGNRASKYVELDVLNEALNNPAYWNIYNPTTAGASTLSIASIYNDVAAAAAAAGNPNLKLDLNEYNVLQFSPAAISSAGVESGSDQYANWYRNEVEAVKNAGGAVSGIGMQEYVSLTATGSNAHSAATIQKALQNLSIEGLPLTMAEYGHASGTTAAQSSSLGPAAMDAAVRVFYGNPQATTFMVWGWWDTSGNTPPAQMIVTTPGASTYTLTALGQEWVSLMNEFSTHTTGVVDANGNISFNGYYGDYNIGTQSGFSNLTLAKGTTGYSLSLAAPPQWSLWNANNSGTWGGAGNWTAGGIASATGQTAYFGSASGSRLITVDSPRTVGMLAFDSAAKYTLAGATISLHGSAGQAAVYVATGSHEITAPLALLDNTTFTVAPVGATLSISTLQPTTAGITKSGAGSLVVNGIRAAGLNVAAGTVRLTSGPSDVGSLAIAGTTDARASTLDLTNGSVIVHYSGASPLGTIQNQIKSGAAGGSWNGTGITSSTAVGAPHTALGFAEASALGLTRFAGDPIAGNAVVVAYTLAGDQNLDGVVNAMDFNVIATNFGQATATWTTGDFNYDGVVDMRDFEELAQSFGRALSSPPLGSAVPEPGVAGLMTLAVVALRRSKRVVKAGKRMRTRRRGGAEKHAEKNSGIEDRALKIESACDPQSSILYPRFPIFSAPLRLCVRISSAHRTTALIGLLAAAGITRVSQAQTSLTGSSLAIASQNSATLSTTSYVGTYLVVPAGGATINLTANVTAGASGAGNPNMQLVVADTTASFSVSSTSATNYTTSNFFLPAGTYAVRDQRDFNDNSGVSRNFTVNNLSVNTVGGSTATFLNTNNGTTSLAAADSYIQNYRQGPATVAMSGPGNVPLLGGTAVAASLSRINFDFGTAVPGSSPSGVNTYLGTNGTTQQTQYQAHLLQNFNTIVPENMGKWGNDESTQGGTSNMSGIDTMLNYAQNNHLFARMHNVIWGSQQPGFATTLLSQAAAGSMTSQTTLRNDISSRINYYVGTGLSTDRSNKYQQLDVYNESYHTGQTVAGSYWNVYTPTGIADIYRQIHAVAPNAKLFTNEYNIYEDGADKYAAWYQQHLEQIRTAGLAAGYGDVVSGIGTQYYPDQTTSVYTDPNQAGVSGSAHDPARVMQTIQNLSTEGLPITLTEFGVKPPGATGSGAAAMSLTPATEQSAANILSDTMRIVFGNPNSSGFMMWGFQAEGSGTTFGTNLFQSQSALYTVTTTGTGAWSAANWQITPAGEVWQELLGIGSYGVLGSDNKALGAWTTHLTGASAPLVGPNGQLSFTGYYGDYNIGSASGFSNLPLVKGTTQYSLALTAPPNWSLWQPSGGNAMSSASNWSTGGVPNAGGQTAYFGQSTLGVNVNSDSARTLGMIAFSSTGSYTIGGTGTITLQGFNNASGHAAAVYVAAGAHQINAPLAIADNTTFTSVAGSSLTITNLQSTTATLTKMGTGTFLVNALRSPSVALNGGTTRLIPTESGGTTSVVGGLSLAGGTDAWASTLDLTDASAIVTYIGTSPLSTIQNQIKSAANNGWTGTGITSSYAAAVAADSSNPHKTAIGFGEASALSLSTFGGQPVTGSAILMRYTLAGDSNLDGVVNALDFNAVATSFGTSGSTWMAGDFNYEGAVDTADFMSISQNFGATFTPGPALSLGQLLPEPGGVALLLASACLTRRRRHR